MEKKKFRFNVVDLFIIIIAVLLVMAFGYYANGRISNDKKSDTIRYTVSFEGFSEEFKDLVKVGDKIWNIDRDCEAGYVVEVTPAVKDVKYNENVIEGTFVKAEVPDKYRCEITVESPYTNTGSGYFIDQTEIKTGKRIALRTPNFAFSGVILDIERSDG